VTALGRLLKDVRALIRAEVPALTFAGIYEYTVQGAAGSKVDASPTDTTLGLPTITGLPLSPSILGETVASAAVGCKAIVQFVNGSPTRPEVVSLSLPPSSSTIDATGTLQLGPNAQAVQLAGGTAPIARHGDAVTIYLDPGPALVNGTVGGVPFVGSIVFVGPATGIIVGGQPKATA
jgi:hypothetical protein